MANNKIPKNFMEATGKLNCLLTNDLMFIYLMQENYTFLLAFVCALLHMSPNDVQSLKITNRINLGDHLEDKTFILDIRLLLNDNTLVNIELQVVNQNNWTERSLGYLCSSFDQLNSGDDYKNTKPTIHISILDFNIKELPPEFYSSYMMLNTKNHAVYSSKFQLNVLNLKKIKLATQEDKSYNIDQYARLFKATTWRDVQMLAQNNAALAAAAETMLEFSIDPELQYYYEKRQASIIHERVQRETMKELTVENADLKSKYNDAQLQITDLESKYDDAQLQITDLESKYDDAQLQITGLESKYNDLANENDELKRQLASYQAQDNK